MKKVFLVVSVAFFLVVSIMLIQSCNSDIDSEIEMAQLDIPEEYNEVGKLHNEALEYVFEDIKVQAIEFTKNPQLKSCSFMDDKDEFIRQSVLGFCSQNETLKKNIDICKNALNSNISLKSSNKAETFSPATQQLLDEVMSVLSQKIQEKELSMLKKQLDVINQKAAEKLSEIDAAIIYCAASTGYCSYQYWMKNHKKWYFALNYPEILEQYNNEELNQLQMKNGRIQTKGWSDVWNSVENWWNSSTDAVSNWWNDYGAIIVASDALGAGFGAIKAYATAGAGTLVFGPTGLVVVTAAGAVTYGAESSVASAIVSGLVK